MHWLDGRGRCEQGKIRAGTLQGRHTQREAVGTNASRTPTSTVSPKSKQVGLPGHGSDSEASTFRESRDTQYRKTSAIASSHVVSTYCKRCFVPFNVEGNEAENDSVCPSLP